MAKIFSCQYTGYKGLKHFIQTNNLHRYKYILVQVFLKDRDEEAVRVLQKAIRRLLPNGQMVGCASLGSIYNGKLTKGKTTIHFTGFEHTRIQTVLMDESELATFGEEKGNNQEWTSPDLKTYMVFSAGENPHLERLHRNLSKNKEVIVVGGMIGQEDGDESGFLFTHDRIITKGAAFAFFYNRHLSVTPYLDGGWSEANVSFRVTAKTEKRVLKINDENPLKFLRTHFRNLFDEKDLPEMSSIPFLFTRKGGGKVAHIRRFFEDGTFEVSIIPDVNEEYTLSYPNGQRYNDRLKRFSEHPVETIFLFASSWRNDVFPFFTEEEMKHLQYVSPVAGCLTEGEFVSDGRTLSPRKYTIQAIGLSESPAEGKKGNVRFDVTGERNLSLYFNDLLAVEREEYEKLHGRFLTIRQYFDSLFDHNDDIVFSIDLYGRFTSVNQTFVTTFGIEEEKIIGKSVLDYIKRTDIREVKRYFIQSLKGHEQSYQIELPIAGGQIQIFQIRNIPIIINGKPEGIIGFGRNITENKKFEEKIIQLAYYDKDTSLPNRTLITEIVTEEIERAKREKTTLAVMFIDIDRFKMINDSLGHYIGDQVIKEIAYRIKSNIADHIQLGRFGGDKFTLIFPKQHDSGMIVKTGNKLLQLISKPIVYDGQEFFLSASAGVSFYPNDGKDTELLLKNADTAMNRAKKQGGNKVIFFSNEMNSQVKYRFELENYLRRAIEKDELYLYYQPLVDLHSGKIIGSEALVRWNHPKLGLIPPLTFIPIAEETGLIHEIGNWVLHEACRQNKQWMDDGLGELFISVNVSSVQFQHPAFIDQVKAALEEANLDPKYLHLELTESGMLLNLQHTIETMKALQDFGVKVSIDDFGTGYSSLSYLKNLPINSLKIDRSLIHNIHAERVDRSIVQAIITMGNGLAVKIVAEGVETFEQIEELKKLNCDYAQGYYIERPIDPHSFAERIKGNGRMIYNS